MEKFGIFELLDALSAIASASSGENAPPAPPERTAPSAEDAVYRPPVYGGEAPSPSAAPPEKNALADLLARHDALVKKIDGKK